MFAGNERRWWSLQWRLDGRDNVSNHQPHVCFLNRLFRHRSKKTSKLCVTGLCGGNSSGAGDFPAKWPVTRKFFIWWRHHYCPAFADSSAATWLLDERKMHICTPQRAQDAIITSLWRQNDVATSLLRHNDVIIASFVRCDSECKKKRPRYRTLRLEDFERSSIATDALGSLFSQNMD